MRTLIALLLSALVAGVLGCSGSEDRVADPTGGPVLLTEMTPPDDTGAKSPFVDDWNHFNGVATLSIQQSGHDSFRLHGEGPTIIWNGIGHQRGDQLIAMWWAEWHIDPQLADKHAYVTYQLDGDVMYHTSYNPDGSYWGSGGHTRAVR